MNGLLNDKFIFPNVENGIEIEKYFKSHEEIKNLQLFISSPIEDEDDWWVNLEDDDDYFEDLNN